ncbi:MAG: iron donor protein CyaY [Candidatus Accumulibacter sp.]|jgi:CyaY protein|nr:iron donor protein CyaY [Accumulibacter sp.]
MRENEFVDLTGQALAGIELKLDASGLDLDCAAVSDGVLEIGCGDGGKIVVNRHAANQEIWVAGRSGGFHFRWDKDAWRSARDGRELLAVLSELVSLQTGVRVDLAK